MAKANTIKVKLLSTAETGYFYVTKKNSRTMTDKITQRKYDPVARKHVEFKETKIKQPDVRLQANFATDLLMVNFFNSQMACSRTASKNFAIEIGFDKQASQPLPRIRSSSPFMAKAVTAMIGIDRVKGSAFSH